MAYTFGMSKIGATSGAMGRRYRSFPSGTGSGGGITTQPPYQPRPRTPPVTGFRAFPVGTGSGGGYVAPSAQPLPEYAPSHPGYQSPVGPLVRTLPQTATSPVGPLTPLGMGHSVQQRGGYAPQQAGLASVPDRPFGMTMPQPTAGGMLQNGQPRVFPGSGNVYYRDNAYNPTLNQRRQDDAGVASILSQNRAAGSGPYDQGGMAHFGPLQSRPAPTMTPPPVGTMYAGRSRVAEIDGRRVLLGPNASEGDYHNTEAGQAGARGAAGVYRDTISEPNAANLAYAARAADRAAGLREGRRNRAIAKYGLTHLQPTQNYTYDSNIGVGGGYARTGLPTNVFGGPLATGGGRTPGITESKNALASISSGPFAKASGFDAGTASVEDAVDTFMASGDDWSPSDLQAFKNDIATRYQNDKEFAKMWDAWLSRESIDYRVETPTDADIARENKLRALFGRPPIAKQKLPLLPDSGAMGPPLGYMPYGAP